MQKPKRQKLTLDSMMKDQIEDYRSEVSLPENSLHDSNQAGGARYAEDRSWGAGKHLGASLMVSVSDTVYDRIREIAKELGISEGGVLRLLAEAMLPEITPATFLSKILKEPAQALKSRLLE